MELSKGVKELVAEAMGQVLTLSPAEVDARLSRAGVLLVDLRDVREVKRDGKIPDALHVPRGMLEFWIDRKSTRLNSSHALISYAVFCLKKKNNKNCF